MTSLEIARDFIVGQRFECELAQIADKHNVSHTSLKSMVEDIFDNWDIVELFEENNA